MERTDFSAPAQVCSSQVNAMRKEPAKTTNPQTIFVQKERLDESFSALVLYVITDVRKLSKKSAEKFRKFRDRLGDSNSLFLVRAP